MSEGPKSAATTECEHISRVTAFPSSFVEQEDFGGELEGLTIRVCHLAGDRWVRWVLVVGFEDDRHRCPGHLAGKGGGASCVTIHVVRFHEKVEAAPGPHARLHLHRRAVGLRQANPADYLGIIRIHPRNDEIGTRRCVTHRLDPDPLTRERRTETIAAQGHHLREVVRSWALVRELHVDGYAHRRRAGVNVTR